MLVSGATYAVAAPALAKWDAALSTRAHLTGSLVDGLAVVVSIRSISSHLCGLINLSIGIRSVSCSALLAVLMSGKPRVNTIYLDKAMLDIIFFGITAEAFRSLFTNCSSRVMPLGKLIYGCTTLEPNTLLSLVAEGGSELPFIERVCSTNFNRQEH